MENLFMFFAVKLSIPDKVIINFNQCKIFYASRTLADVEKNPYIWGRIRIRPRGDRTRPHVSGTEKRIAMNKSVLTIVRLVFFSIMLVLLVVLMVLNITERGIETGTDKILLALFIVLIIWAAARIYGLVKALRDR